MKKRKIEIAVISDVHLGTLESRADELLSYLSSINPGKLILNGDIIDVWQFSKRYFPPSHMKVLRKLISMASKGTEVFYITGNHDEMLRKFSGTSMGNLHVVDKLVLQLHGKKAWFFHGDVFDLPIQNAKWLAKLGSYSYYLLILVNRWANWVLIKLGKERYSLSRKIRKSASQAEQYTQHFEESGVRMAIEHGYDYVVCGHIHQPKKQVHTTKRGSCTYLNSGDWIESLTALEYSFKRWKIYRYKQDKLLPFFVDEELKEMDINELIASISATVEKKNKDKESID